MKLKKKGRALLASVLAVACCTLAVSASATPAATGYKLLAKNVNQPAGMAADAQGKIYLSVMGDSMIATLSKKAELFAGQTSPLDPYNQAVGGYADGALKKAAFRKPAQLIYFQNGLLTADSGNNMIRLIKNGAVFTYAGGRTAGYQDGTRQTALFSMPTGLAADGEGNVYVADTGNQVIRRIGQDGQVTTVAGVAGKAGFADGAAGAALLCDPMGLAWRDGALYIADSGNQRVRVLRDGKLTTLAGGGTQKFSGTQLYAGGYVNGAAANARFNNPRALTFDEAGNLYIADSDNGAIRVYAGGQVSTLLDSRSGKVAQYLAEPCGLLVQEGKLLVADSFTGSVIAVTLA